LSKQTALLLGLALACAILLIGASSVSAWKFAAIGDIECKSAVKVATSIKTHTPDVKRVVLLGDLGYGKSSKCIADAFKGLSLVVVVGNHDKAKDVQKSFGLTSNLISTYKTENVRFLTVDTEQSISAIKSKVSGLLNKYKNATDIDWIIPVSHKPYVTSDSTHHKESEAKGFRSALVPLYVDNNKVQIVLFGHNHDYLHCSSDGIQFIQVGTGGRDPYPLGTATDDNCRNGITGTNGYLEVQVNGTDMVGVFKDMNGGMKEDTTFQILK